MTDIPLPAGATVIDPWDDVRLALNATKSAANELALALEDVVKHESWRRFDQPTYGAVEHTTLREFIEAKPNAGLGLTVEAVTALLGQSNYTRIAYDLTKLLTIERV